MASFHNKTFLDHDDYMTNKSTWKNIKHLIPNDKIIWEPFYGDGKSGQYLRELGFEVIHEPIDFFENDLGQIIVSNPPFSLKKEIFTRLVELGKPFIMISPSSMINTQYIRKLFAHQDTNQLQIILPRKRLQFVKLVDGKIPKNYRSGCNFDCFYFCWKLNLDRDITWLV